MAKYKFHQRLYGIIFIVLGILVITLAIIVSPAFAARYLSFIHKLTLPGINKLNRYRHIVSFIGIIFIVCGIVLETVKDIWKKLQTFFSSLSKKIKKSLIVEDDQPGRIPSGIIVLFFGIIGIIGFLLILWITPFGAGVSPDSVVYIGSAQKIMSGKGYSGSHFPPLYPIFLAAAGFLESNLVQAARFLNAILFGLNLAFFALMVYLTTGHKFINTIFAVLFFLSSASILELHSYAWSEPLFITFSLICICLLCIYSGKPTLPLFIASSLSLGFAMVTRYVGAGFLPAALIIVFWGQDSQRTGRRFRDSFIWLALSCVPLIIFFLKNFLLYGSPTDRNFAYHPLSITRFISKLATNLFDYIAPTFSLANSVKVSIFGVFTILLICLLIFFMKRYREDSRWRSMGFLMAIACILFSAFYLLFLFISISTMDASTPVDSRLLSPISIFLAVGVFSAVWAIAQKLDNQFVWLGFLFLVVLSIASKTPGAISLATDIQKNGLGYTSRQWQDSESLAFVKLHAGNRKVYSNVSDVLNFLAGAQSIFLPEKKFPLLMEANPDYNEEISAMCEDVTDHEALLVYFNNLTDNWYLPSAQEIESTCHLPVLQQFTDGIVYGEISR
jgi:hypothetical protein